MVRMIVATPNPWWYESTQILCNSSRMVGMMSVATPSGCWYGNTQILCNRKFWPAAPSGRWKWGRIGTVIWSQLCEPGRGSCCSIPQLNTVEGPPLYTVVQWWMHSVGREDCLLDRFLLRHHMGSHTPPSFGCCLHFWRMDAVMQGVVHGWGQSLHNCAAHNSILM